MLSFHLKIKGAKSTCKKIPIRWKNWLSKAWTSFSPNRANSKSIWIWRRTTVTTSKVPSLRSASLFPQSLLRQAAHPPTLKSLPKSLLRSTHWLSCRLSLAQNLQPQCLLKNHKCPAVAPTWCSAAHKLLALTKRTYRAAICHLNPWMPRLSRETIISTLNNQR